MQAEGKGKFEVDYAEGVRITEGRVWAQDSRRRSPRRDQRQAPRRGDRDREERRCRRDGAGRQRALSREAWADNHLGDSESLDWSGRRTELAKEIFALGKPVVVILLNGRPYSVNYLAENAPALIEGWYLGEQTGNALADVVFGRYNPGGKLPVSIARNVGQLPIYYNHKPSARRGYLFGDTSPLYPFGYGLSYTSFDIAAPVLATPTIGIADNVKVNVDVTNTGKRAGDEVVQLYVRDDEASVTRPVIELKRFERVTLHPARRRR
jgi:beta-glucosidase